MPYILSPIIYENSPAMWGEGLPYTRQVIFKKPEMPINYSSYTLKPHALPHMETRAHIDLQAPTIDHYFKEKNYRGFFGSTLVVKLQGLNYSDHPTIPDIKKWEVTKEELQEKFEQLNHGKIPNRLLLSVDQLPKMQNGLADQNYVLILTKAAADYLISNPHFCLYGTSYKSTDFNPGSFERPIHQIIFKQALILECLEMSQVPEGLYFLNAFPLPLENASESPVCPVLFTFDELTSKELIEKDHP